MATAFADSVYLFYLILNIAEFELEDKKCIIEILQVMIELEVDHSPLGVALEVENFTLVDTLLSKF